MKFLIFRHGIYRHECVFCGDTEQEARKKALELIQLEPDDYHTMELVSIVNGLEPETILDELYRQLERKKKIFWRNTRTKNLFLEIQSGP